MRILFVALADSSHTVRWLEQLNGLGWDLHLLPVSQKCAPNVLLRDVAIHDLFLHDRRRYQSSLAQSASVPWPFPQGRSKAQRVLERLTLGRASYPARLARLIEKLRPDAVHTLEMQQAGYMMAQCRRQFPQTRLVPWIYSSWGSDIYYWGRQPEHEARVRDVLSHCDFYIADCDRDRTLAREFGFRGEYLGTFPGVGGFDLDRMRGLRSAGPVSARRAIALKGYHDDKRFGRAMVALRAMRLCQPHLAGYELLVYSSTPGVPQEAQRVAGDLGMRLTVLPASPSDEVLKLLGRSRVAIGLSTSDGTPNAMLEAMVMGAFPIQSDTQSTAEWIHCGVNGCIVPAEDERAVADAIVRAMGDDRLVDEASTYNARLTSERIDQSVIRPRVIAAYERAAAAGGADQLGPAAMETRLHP